MKAELDKLGAPSRSFSEYLLLDNNAAADGGESMEDCAALGEPKRMLIGKRFARVERARPSVHPITIQIARRLKKVQEQNTTNEQSSG